MGQYRVGELARPEAEVSRLAEQVRLLAAQEQAALRAVGLPAAGRGLDLGCGPGFFAEALMRAFPDLRLLGLDIDAYVLPAARRRLPVVRADARRTLPFPEGSFDVAYGRLFLRHTPAPARVLAEMVRVVRRGGCVAAIDSADATLLLDPAPGDFAAVAAARREWFGRRGCSADLGQRLPRLFWEAGLAEIQVRPIVLDSDTIGADVFARIVLAPFVQAAEAVLDDRARLDAAAAAVATWAGQPGAFGSISVFVVGGRRPAA